MCEVCLTQLWREVLADYDAQRIDIGALWREVLAEENK